MASRRHLACRDLAEARKDAADRAAILAALEAQRKRGDKALVGDSASRRFLRATGKAFAVDHHRAAAAAKLDGVFVLRTSARLTPLQAVLQYRRLRVVEDLFRTATSILRTRPVFHSSDAAIRGRVFCSFLALVPRDELLRRCRAAGLKPEWGDVLRDLDRLQRGTIEQGGKTWRVRTEGGATAAALLRACGIAVPPRIQGIPPPAVDPPNPAPLPESRGRPRRGATRS